MKQSTFCARWVGVLVVVCLVVGGCGSSGGGDRPEVVVGEPSLKSGVVGSAVGDDTGQVPGDSDGESPGPGGPVDGGGDGEGPVGDTGGSTGDVVLPGGYAELISPEFVRGGLVLLPEPSLPVGLVNEVVDLCDDSAAFLKANGRALGPGEVATEEELLEVLMVRSASGVDCDVSGGRRYIYVGNGWSTSPAHPTVAEALAHRDRIEAPWVDARKRRPDGKLLGYHGMFKREFPLEPRDEVVVLADTVSVSGGVVRGLVHNLSESLYARNVVVSAGDSSWRWPLTVQPGERAPFEIEGWQGSNDPTEIALSVTADTSTVFDLSRAFKIGENRPEPQRGSYVSMSALLTEPTSPPGLAEAIQQLTIEDPRAFIALVDLDDGTVMEVEQTWRGFHVWYGNETTSGGRVISMESFPATADDLPEDLASQTDLNFYFRGAFGFPAEIVFGADLGNHTNYDLQAWFGGATPATVEQTPDDDAASDTAERT